MVPKNVCVPGLLESETLFLWMLTVVTPLFQSRISLQPKFRSMRWKQFRRGCPKSFPPVPASSQNSHFAHAESPGVLGTVPWNFLSTALLSCGSCGQQRFRSSPRVLEYQIIMLERVICPSAALFCPLFSVLSRCGN